MMYDGPPPPRPNYHHDGSLSEACSLNWQMVFSFLSLFISRPIIIWRESQYAPCLDQPANERGSCAIFWEFQVHQTFDWTNKAGKNTSIPPSARLLTGRQTGWPAAAMETQCITVEMAAATRERPLNNNHQILGNQKKKKRRINMCSYQSKSQQQQEKGSCPCCAPSARCVVLLFQQPVLSIYSPLHKLLELLFARRVI